eukprot:scaffold1924_cov218-Amphora_coffeaeformis.AAC.5
MMIIISQKKALPRTTTPSPLYGIRCENKYYQLEEMEDSDNCTTELFLTADGLVEFGETDGPMWDEVAGNWHVKPGTDDFTMVIFRRFGTGRSGTDMGEFAYEIGRVYKGEMTKVGDSVAITGVMHSQPDEFSQEDRQIGYFNMIDGRYSGQWIRQKVCNFPLHCDTGFSPFVLLTHASSHTFFIADLFHTGTDVREDRRADARSGVQQSS